MDVFLGVKQKLVTGMIKRITLEYAMFSYCFTIECFVIVVTGICNNELKHWIKCFMNHMFLIDLIYFTIVLNRILCFMNYYLTIVYFTINNSIMNLCWPSVSQFVFDSVKNPMSCCSKINQTILFEKLLCIHWLQKISTYLQCMKNKHKIVEKVFAIYGKRLVFFC